MGIGGGWNGRTRHAACGPLTSLAIPRFSHLVAFLLGIAVEKSNLQEYGCFSREHCSIEENSDNEKEEY